MVTPAPIPADAALLSPSFLSLGSPVKPVGCDAPSVVAPALIVELAKEKVVLNVVAVADVDAAVSVEEDTACVDEDLGSDDELVLDTKELVVALVKVVELALSLLGISFVVVAKLVVVGVDVGDEVPFGTSPSIP